MRCEALTSIRDTGRNLDVVDRPGWNIFFQLVDCVARCPPRRDVLHDHGGVGNYAIRNVVEVQVGDAAEVFGVRGPVRQSGSDRRHLENGLRNDKVVIVPVEHRIWPLNGAACKRMIMLQDSIDAHHRTRSNGY